MGPEDVKRFRATVRRHLLGQYTEEERRQIDEYNARTEHLYQRILANNGGRNPLLG